MGADTTTSRLPDARFLVSHPAHFIALGFGSGLAPLAPGTFGTLVGWALAMLLLLAMPPLFVAFFAIPLFFLGVWACERTGRDLGVQDHGSMVWDEIVAFLPLAAVASASLVLQLVAFLLFRLFDIWKPYPIRLLEANVKGGLGVMVDDLVAGFYAYVAFVIFIVVMHKGFGFQ
ncbi:MAG TPA: phosphatidylglycerophosphatase A [Usitatibacter sp.]|nr:phosphatidylglycerophosphatase A [Usitatibacter sp.]